jgi:hypothetical protein
MSEIEMEEMVAAAQEWRVGFGTDFIIGFSVCLARKSPSFLRFVHAGD